MTALRYTLSRMAYARGRTLLSVLAVAAAIVLVIVLEGFKVGLYRQIRDYPTALGAPLIATQAGVKNMTGARSVIPLPAARAVRELAAVAAVHPLVGVPTVYAAGARKTPIYLIAYHDLGGPRQLRAGRAIAGAGEVVVDAGLARKHDLRVGASLSLFGRELTIVGIAGGAGNVFNPFVYMRLTDAAALAAGMAHGAEHPPGVSFLLIEPAPGRTPGQVRAAIEAAVPAVDVHTPAEIARNDEAMAAHLMGGVMNLLVAVAYAVGVLVIGLTLLASVLERLRELGVMKALGASRRNLYGEVLLEALLLTAAGLVVGVLASQGVAALVQQGAPQYLVVPWSPGPVARTAAAALAMALVASLLPLRHVAAVDPVLVFRR